MYDHIGLKVNDIGASVRFYESALKPLGHEVGHVFVLVERPDPAAAVVTEEVMALQRGLSRTAVANLAELVDAMNAIATDSPQRLHSQ